MIRRALGAAAAGGLAAALTLGLTGPAGAESLTKSDPVGDVSRTGYTQDETSDAVEFTVKYGKHRVKVTARFDRLRAGTAREFSAVVKLPGGKSRVAVLSESTKHKSGVYFDFEGDKYVDCDYEFERDGGKDGWMRMSADAACMNRGEPASELQSVNMTVGDEKPSGANLAYWFDASKTFKHIRRH